ncbi:hypothetical protein ACFXPI_34415 [Streptomyces sp. NPDC059104]|uniref:hypothetical protein n=1 Tax=Streptomyces sp. NPDC059104 TaxID=3346729 RepID=UPI0036AF8713
MGRTKWAAGAAAGAVGLGGAGVAVVCGLLWSTAGDDTDHGWFRVREIGPVAAGGGPSHPSRAEAQAGLADAAAAAGLTPGTPHPAQEGDLADCVADWTGSGPADPGRWRTLEAALGERGWQVTSRRGGPAPATSLKNGPWDLVVTNGGLLNTLSLVALSTTPPCEAALRHDAETRGVRG